MEREDEGYGGRGVNVHVKVEWSSDFVERTREMCSH